jgi:beta-lactamase regulating signal transducer with metallopeptidase domain
MQLMHILISASVGLLVLSIVAFFLRRRFPRTAIFVFSIWFILIGVWLLDATYNYAQQDLAFSFSKHNATFAKLGHEMQYQISVWFHSLVGLMLIMLGCYSAVSAFVRKKVEF